MTDSLSWYQRRLQGGSAPASAPPRSTPGTQAFVPRHGAPAPAYGRPPATPIEAMPGEVVPTDENGQIHFMDAAMRWRGGKGTKTETGRCPECGSANFFSRKEGTKMTANGPVAPAPQCFDCGFNGVYEPFGGDLNSTVG